MVDRIEEFLKVKVNGVAVSLPYVLLYLTYCLVGGTVRSEPIAVVRKEGVEDRGQHLGDRLLNDTIKDRGDTQRSGSSTILWNLCPLNRRRYIGPLQKSGFDLLPVPEDVFRELLDRHIVYTRSPFVRLHLFPRFLQVLFFEDLRHCD
ncbi:MAG: hypothetical protein A4E62_03110 [Syntrophorhabdus sp. PtaU1.Bin002]|nr:MAG: hypothetical protein A4E62_03110 [Syntrophorhabdus sp. PtaU1.Bin002]